MKDSAINDTDRIKQMVSDLLAEAKRQGASSAEAGISMSEGLSVTVRMGDVETVEHTRDKGLGVTVYFGHRKGSASTTDFGVEAVRETVEAACRIARHTAEDDCAGLADADRMAREIPDLDLHHPWDLEPDAAVELALVAEDAARGCDQRITNSEGATVARHEGGQVYGNSHGFLGAFRGTRHSLSCAVIAEDESGMQRDDWYTSGRVPGDLEPAAAVGKMAAQRTVQRLSPRKLGTSTVPVIYAAEVATGLFGHFIAAIRGGNLYRKASFLLDSLGKPVFPEGMHIHEQPHLPRALGSAPFDGEGVATTARDLVADGVLQGYVLNSYSARKLGMQTTGNAGGVRNLTVDGGEQDLAALLKSMGSGLLVTELIGMGVNTVTGDYSRGVAGFWVEQGEIQYPVQEITVAGNLRDMFMGIRAVGGDVERRGNIRTGSVLIEGMTVAGD